MKAAIHERPGSPEVLRYADVADPACGPDELILRVEAISIEGGDLINRATVPSSIIGYAAAGVIVEAGENVADRRVGQKVTSFDLLGSHAELRAVPASRTWLVPGGLTMSAATALPIAFGTAHHCLFAVGALQAGQTVLIQAGAGGVGAAAIQLAHRAGARVISTVSGDERTKRLAALGLDHAINHRVTDVAKAVAHLTGGQGVDLVVEP